MLTSEIYAPGKIHLIDVPEPELSAAPLDGVSGQIIFQPETTCLCGSDLPYFNRWDEWPIEQGHSLHEMIGTVTATNGKKWNVGDRVLAVPCKQQGLSERFILDENRAITVATNIPEEQALMAQPLGTAIFALKKLPNILDLDVVVVGQGPMGQLMNASLRNMGSARDRLSVLICWKAVSKRSPKMGATATVCNAKDDPVVAVKEILGGSLADIVIECVGHADQQFDLSIDLCKHAGRILVFGVPPKAINSRNWRDMFFKGVWTVHTLWS